MALLKDNDSHGAPEDKDKNKKTNTTLAAEIHISGTADGGQRAHRHADTARGPGPDQVKPGTAHSRAGRAGGAGGGMGWRGPPFPTLRGCHHIDRFGSVVLREVGTVPSSPLAAHQREEKKKKDNEEKENTHTQSHSRYLWCS